MFFHEMANIAKLLKISITFYKEFLQILTHTYFKHALTDLQYKFELNPMYNSL